LVGVLPRRPSWLMACRSMMSSSASVTDLHPRNERVRAIRRSSDISSWLGMRCADRWGLLKSKQHASQFLLSHKPTSTAATMETPTKGGSLDSETA
jgi:hypothetical protein